MDFIKEFWNNQAKKFGTSSDASWSDQFALDLEITNISKYIKDGDKVLDAGCANGYSATQQCLRKDIEMIGIDFSEEMINQARIAIASYEWPDDMKSSFRVQVADIKALPFEANTFDVTYTTRVLINLPTWEEQQKGILECMRVTKPGGTIVLSEAFYEPLQRLNALRLIANLKPLVEHDFNRYIKKDVLEEFLTTLFDKSEFECIDFSSVYYLGSRFLRELVTKAEDYKGYSNPINEKFYELEKEFSGGNFGIQQIYILKK
jgi:ubiquinone/menaquinone biosynthesis C-methylase UbiE